jgi:galactitol-specific phosphotransferase system IIC component
MIRRVAGAMALIAFALCLIMGILAGNPFVTTLERALQAMFVLFFVGLVVGWMAQRMLDENLSDQEKKSENEESNSTPQDR